MARILDLSTEVLLMIIKDVEDEGSRQRKAAVSRLSLVCKRLNDVCGHILFRSYPLVLRKKVRNSANSPLELWNVKVIRSRLRHLRSKAPFVRVLRLIDDVYRSSTSDGPQVSFPPEFVPKLLESLKTLERVVSVEFYGSYAEESVPFAAALWDWLATVRPTTLAFEGIFTFPKDLQQIDGVEELTMKPYKEGTSHVVELLRAPTLHLRYISGDTHVKLVPYAGLKSLEVTADILRAKLPPRLSDFTQVPELEVKMKFFFDVDFTFHRPAAWNQASRQLPTLFVDDLASWDVRRYDGLTLKRYPPGFEGELRQDHLPNEEKEKEEQEEIARHYQRRAEQARWLWRY
ncbi:hypothetical protein DENSPDRAFT_853052 [Dentipellis sp. KUC8613]|nr:hypothetical protein DENSPDRAFT_853052 [Dentipellis sp. KUC8613]